MGAGEDGQRIGTDRTGGVQPLLVQPALRLGQQRPVGGQVPGAQAGDSTGTEEPPVPLAAQEALAPGTGYLVQAHRTLPIADTPAVVSPPDRPPVTISIARAVPRVAW